jgi:cell division protein FtsW
MDIRFGMEHSGKPRRADQLLTASVFLLTGLGLVTLYSASYAFSERFFGSGLYFISRQIVLAALGFALFFIVSRINLEAKRGWIKPLVI